MDLSNLKTRTLFAKTHGYEIARTSQYLAEMGNPPAPQGITAGSLDHLLAVIGMAEKGTLPKTPVAAPKPALVPVEPKGTMNMAQVIRTEAPKPEVRARDYSARVSEAPKAEAPKVEASKPEAPKPEAPKAAKDEQKGKGKDKDKGKDKRN